MLITGRFGNFYPKTIANPSTILLMKRKKHFDSGISDNAAIAGDVKKAIKDVNDKTMEDLLKDVFDVRFISSIY